MDKLVRAIAKDGSMICLAIDSTNMVREAEQIHKTSATVTAALGRLLTGASMMGGMLKDTDHTLTLRLSGNGPVGSVIAVADAIGNARGYVTNPIVELPLNNHGKLDVAGAVGTDGYLCVSKDVGLPEPQMGFSPIVSGEIAEDLTYYYATSEQIPTVCALGVLVNPDLTVKAAGGYIVQLLPGADDEVISRLEQNINKLPAISTMIRDGLSPYDVINKALDGFEPEVMDEREVSYLCNCSKARVERALISIGAEELTEMAKEQEITEVGCHFCNKKYTFTSAELLKFLD